MSSVLCLLKKSIGRGFLDKMAGETRRLIFLLILSIQTPNMDLKKPHGKRSDLCLFTVCITGSSSTSGILNHLRNKLVAIGYEIDIN